MRVKKNKAEKTGVRVKKKASGCIDDAAIYLIVDSNREMELVLGERLKQIIEEDPDDFRDDFRDDDDDERAVTAFEISINKRVVVYTKPLITVEKLTPADLPHMKS